MESCFYGKETEEFNKIKGGVSAGPLALLKCETPLLDPDET